MAIPATSFSQSQKAQLNKRAISDHISLNCATYQLCSTGVENYLYMVDLYILLYQSTSGGHSLFFFNLD